MREPLRDSECLKHISDAIDNIFEFTEGVLFEDYCANKMLRFVVVKNLEIIGKAATCYQTNLKINMQKLSGMILLPCDIY